MTETKEYLKGSVERLLLDLEPKTAIKNFKRKAYTDFFQQYCEKEKEIYAKLLILFAESTKPAEDMQEIAAPLIQKAEDIIQKTSRFTRERELMDLNCVMAFYVLRESSPLNRNMRKNLRLRLPGSGRRHFRIHSLRRGRMRKSTPAFREKYLAYRLSSSAGSITF